VSRPREPARYRLSAHPAIPDDLTSLTVYGTEAVQAARQALDDLAYGRVTGKALGVRHVSGDLRGLASVKFDVPASPTKRFRLVYAEIEPRTRGVIAIGVRDEHAIYRLAADRLAADQAKPTPADDA
jgi:hypothetical protein